MVFMDSEPETYIALAAEILTVAMSEFAVKGEHMETSSKSMLNRDHGFEGMFGLGRGIPFS
jgi:hypothetical protein